jgi:multisubunit Na+/H+ antiporter MnhB subunit
MTGIIVVAVLVVLLYIAYINRESKFKEIERQQAMRRAVLKLNEKHQPFSR